MKRCDFWRAKRAENFPHNQHFLPHNVPENFRIICCFFPHPIRCPVINTTIWTANHYDRLLIITLFYMSKAKHIYRFKLVPVSSHKIYAVLANLKMFGLTVVNLKSKIIMNMFLNSYYLLISTNQVSLTLLLTNLSKGYLNCLAPVFINVHKSHMLTAYTRKFENAVHVSS